MWNVASVLANETPKGCLSVADHQRLGMAGACGEGTVCIPTIDNALHGRLSAKAKFKSVSL
jgi:hypothetical protein